MKEIRFDPTEIVSQLEDLKYKKFTRVRNRKCIDRIVNTYKKYAGGKFPIGIQKMKVDRDELEMPDVEDKTVELLEFEDELLGKQRELKKLAKRKRKRIVSDQKLFDEFQAKSNKIAKLKHDSSIWMEEDITFEDEPTISEKVKTKEIKESKETPKKKQKLKRKKDEDLSESAEKPKIKKSNKTNGWNEPLQDGETEYFIPSKKQQLNGVPRTVTKKDGTIEDTTPIKVNKISLDNSALKKSSTLDETPKRTPKQLPAQKSEKESSVPSIKRIYGSLKTSTPIEKKVKSPSKLTETNNSTPKMATFAEKITPKLIKSTPNTSLMSAEKRVKIVLKMNKSQEATEYIRQLKQSPHLPYDSAEKPTKGVLKPNLMPSPINPFYKKMIGMK